MFDNVGGKIKGVATVITWIGIIVSAIFAITLMKTSEALGILVLVLGCLGSWLSSVFMYGFGQLIENSDILVELLSPDNETEEFEPEKYN